MKLRLAQSMGTLSLVLRKLNDTSKAGESMITAESVRLGQPRGEDEVETPMTAEKAPAKTPAPMPVVEAPKSKEVEVAKEPEYQGKRHVLSIREGDNTKQTEYLVDEDFEIFNPEVRRTELTRPAVRPAPTTPTTSTPSSAPSTPRQPPMPKDE